MSGARRRAILAAFAIAGCGPSVSPNGARADAGLIMPEPPDGAPDERDAAVEDLAASGPADLTPLPDCSCFAGDGLYCGRSIASYGALNGCAAPGLAAHDGDVYHCAAGAWTVSQSCGAAGCYIAPSGVSDGCHVGGATHNLYIVFNTNAAAADLPGLFQCLLAKTNFNDAARQYANGYGLKWGGTTKAACGADQFTCAVSALGSAGLVVSSDDVVMIVYNDGGACSGGDNHKRYGMTVNGVPICGANVSDCSGTSSQERIAVHEAFECAGDWANADCCTGEVDYASCGDNSDADCPSCPCACGSQKATFGGYTLDCGGGKTYRAQQVPASPAGEFAVTACRGMFIEQ